MTCDRAYTDSAIRQLQEAEKRRQHRAELADELRKRLASRRKTRATLMYISEIEQMIDELSPPVIYDNPPNHPVTDEVAFYEATSK